MERPVRHLVRVTSGAITLVVLLLLIQITMAPPAFAASISISPSSGLAGSSATISGSDFLPLSVQLCWDGENCSNLGTATPGASGQINVGVTIPSDAPPGRHRVSACQLAVGCTSTVYDVTDSSTETSAPTTSPTTSTTTTTTTTTSTTTVTTPSSTTTTLPFPTSTRPSSGGTSPTSPPTTTPVTTSTVPTPQTTTAGTTPDSSVTTTTINNSTTTTDGSTVLAAAASQPPTAPAPFSLDLSKLRFGMDPDAVTADGEPPPEGMGAEIPLAAAEDGATVSKLRFGSDAAATTPGFALPRVGIWLGWLVLVVGSFVVIVGFEEVQRRKEG